MHAVVQANTEYNKNLSDLGIKTKVINYYWWRWLPRPKLEDAGYVNIVAVGEICSYIYENQIDCVVTNTQNTPWGALAAAICNVPHAWIAREAPEAEFEYLKDKYDFISKYSNVLIANSKTLADHLKQKIGLDQTKYFFSYVDISGLKLNSSLQAPRIVSVGDIHKRKNQKELVNAVAILQKTTDLRPQVVLIGDTDADKEYSEYVHKLINKKGLQSTVTITGRVDKPYTKIGPNDILVQTSLSESIGRVATEGMKLGLICIGADIPGTREAFRLGGGILYKSGSEVELADALKKVLTDHPRYKSQALKFQKKALKNMSEEASNGPFFENLEQAMKQPNRNGELHHLRPFFQNMAEHSKLQARQLSDYHQTVKDLSEQLDTIRNQPAWKVLSKINRLARLVRKS